LLLIVVCTACPAQYSVPNAKLRGKKVRITCRHCRTAIVVDGTHLPLDTDGPVSVQDLLQPRSPAPEPGSGLLSVDSVASLLPSFADEHSVHDEPTVIGRIPIAALEQERMFAQRTLPPPAPGADSEPPAPPPPSLSPADVPAAEHGSREEVTQNVGRVNVRPAKAPAAALTYPPMKATRIALLIALAAGLILLARFTQP
jgi:predicted Zn finger-like uncharacterized protein